MTKKQSKRPVVTRKLRGRIELVERTGHPNIFVVHQFESRRQLRRRLLDAINIRGVYAGGQFGRSGIGIGGRIPVLWYPNGEIVAQSDLDAILADEKK